jgi:phosphoadenosine phosphosulfate reductase
MNLEDKAIKFIKTVANSTDQKLYAGNSGGKDSAVLDYLLQKSGIDYNSFYTNTTIDPPKTISHIRTNYPHTEILQPKETFYQLVERKGLPTRLNRYCCEYLKEYGSVGRMVFEGVRSAESRKRQGRDYIQCDTRKWQKGAKHIYPIYDWSDEDVWDFIAKYKIELPPHYEYADRLGCVGCPLVSRKGHREKEFAQYPKYYEAIKKAITKGMANNPQWKITCATDGNGDIAMKWWLSGKTMNEFFDTYSFVKTDVCWKKNKNENNLLHLFPVPI